MTTIVQADPFASPNAAQTERIASALERIATALEQGVLEAVDAKGIMTDVGLPMGAGEPPFPTQAPVEYAAPLPPRPQNGNGQQAIPPQPAGRCPAHNQPWSKLVPAGISRSSGKSYPAFWACPEKGCNERPPR